MSWSISLRYGVGNRLGPSTAARQAGTDKGSFLLAFAQDDGLFKDEFCRRCRMLGIEGRSLHSYLCAWAQRARAASMPEREAMNHLGHESRAIHAAYAAYAGGATVATLPLEFYEHQKLKNVVQFANEA